MKLSVQNQNTANWANNIITGSNKNLHIHLKTWHRSNYEKSFTLELKNDDTGQGTLYTL